MIRKILNRIKNFCYYRVAHNKELTSRIIHHNRKYVIDELYKYPSFINTGHLHFERLFEIADCFNITNLKGKIIDVGGADGITAIMLHDKFRNAEINVFEPLKDNVVILKTNIADYKRIKLFELALGSEKKDSIMNITNRITSSSILKVDTKELKDDYISSQLKPASTEVIKIDTIDNLYNSDDKILVLKLDVQGYELEVLTGAVNTLKNTWIVITEVQNHQLYSGAPMYYDIDKFLLANDFTLLQFIPSLIENQKQLEWDAIYISNKFL